MGPVETERAILDAQYNLRAAVPEPVHVIEAPGAGSSLGHATATPRSSVTDRLLNANALLLVTT